MALAVFHGALSNSSSVSQEAFDVVNLPLELVLLSLPFEYKSRCALPFPGYVHVSNFRLWYISSVEFAIVFCALEEGTFLIRFLKLLTSLHTKCSLNTDYYSLLLRLQLKIFSKGA
jgi:hypothetical protein